MLGGQGLNGMTEGGRTGHHVDSARDRPQADVEVGRSLSCASVSDGQDVLCFGAACAGRYLGDRICMLVSLEDDAEVAPDGDKPNVGSG